MVQIESIVPRNVSRATKKIVTIQYALIVAEFVFFVKEHIVTITLQHFMTLLLALGVLMIFLM